MGIVSLTGIFSSTTEVTMRGRGILGVIVLVWLLIGVFAAWQRNYFKGDQTSCASAGTVAVTVIAGPLNYAGVNPKVKDCHLPQPSSMPAVI
jgi:membrane-bound ClpP family serine protease